MGLRLLLPRPVGELPADLGAVLALVAATVLVVFLPGLEDSSVRVVVGLVFVLFAPAYPFVAMLFPEAGDPPTGTGDPGSDPAAGRDGEAGPDDGVSPGGDRGIDGVERVAFSVGLSIAVVPLLGLALNFTSFGIRVVPIVVTLSSRSGAR